MKSGVFKKVTSVELRHCLRKSYDDTEAAGISLISLITKKLGFDVQSVPYHGTMTLVVSSRGDLHSELYTAIARSKVGGVGGVASTSGRGKANPTAAVYALQRALCRLNTHQAAGTPLLIVHIFLVTTFSGEDANGDVDLLDLLHGKVSLTSRALQSLC